MKINKNKTNMNRFRLLTGSRVLRRYRFDKGGTGMVLVTAYANGGYPERGLAENATRYTTNHCECNIFTETLQEQY